MVSPRGQYWDQNCLFFILITLVKSFNYFSKVSKILNFVLFADDTNIFCTDDKLQQLLAEINLELCQLKI